MKLTLLLLAVMCAALVVRANEGIGEMITEEDVKDIKEGYKDFGAEGMNAPVSCFSSGTDSPTQLGCF
jgi:hypothetical protein